MKSFCDIAIVGGGYAGTVLAIYLARVLPAGGRIVVIEPRDELGAGLAYSTPDEVHCINVPARQLGVSGEADDRFIHWLETHHPQLATSPRSERSSDPARTYVARHWFGAFVRDRLAATLATAAVRVEHWRTIATGARIADGGIELSLAEGSSLRASQVVVATGYGKFAVPAGIPDVVLGSERFVVNPWSAGALSKIGDDEDVLIVGSGLTMADVAASLLTRGHRGKIFAVSRHGLVAQASDPDADIADIDFASWPAAPLSTYVRKLRAEIARVERHGGSWRDVFIALRAQSETLWSKLPASEKQRFLRHGKSFYDVYRHRMAPHIAEQIEAAHLAGQIKIVAGRLRGVRPDRGGLLAEIAPRGGSWIMSRRFGALVNCTGPRQAPQPDPTDFVGALMIRGLAYADPFGLGVTVDRDCRIYGLSRNLYALGPLTRSRFGDTASAPEIMAQAQRLARIVAAALAERHDTASVPDRHPSFSVNSTVGKAYDKEI